MGALAGWYDFAASKDVARLHDLIDPDAVFDSPVVHRPQAGRPLVARYLAGAMQVLGSPAFRYTGEWLNADGAVLEFETEIDGIAINGVDIIHFTADGERIARFKVMIRPLKAIELIRRLMGEALARGAGAA
ncbi:MAG: nuclear transport factor 2 family protein [Sphingomicrobium sp.]